MDYETKYKDALADMKVIYPNLKGDAKKAIEHAFPELADSEDEWIREELICHCKDLVRMNQDDKVMLSIYEPWLAWLEKQKEQKPAKMVRIPKFRVGDIIQHIPLEKWDSTKKITSIDEHGYNYNLSHLGDTVSGGAIGFAFEDEYELVEQKPAEWSEGTKKALDKISDYLKYKGREEDADFIKHLRPQPHWKPSEEQMGALKYALGNGGVFDKDALKSLYNDLKKL